MNCLGPSNKRQQRKTKNQDAASRQNLEQEKAGDEQVYKKDIDDLINYINEPNNSTSRPGQVKETTKKPKKKKKNKKEETIDGEDEGDTGSSVAAGTNKKQKQQPPQKDKMSKSMSPRLASQQDRGKDEESLENEPSIKAGVVKYGNVSSDENLAAKALTDEQFEQAMEKFAKRLEAHCNEAMMLHAKKLRPNYDGTWIVNLQTQLQHFDKRSSGTGASTSVGSQKGQRKH